MNTETKDGYSISYEPMYDERMTKKVKDLMLKMHKIANLGAKDGKKRIEKAIAEYPDIPQFKNYLSVWYAKRGEMDKSFAYNRQIIALHPDYLFAKINMAQEYLQKEELEKVTEILGEAIEIKQIYPERNEFHISEITAVLGIAIQYYLKKNDFKQALLRLNGLKEIAPDSDSIDHFEMQIIGAMFDKPPLFNRRETVRTSIEQPTTHKTEAPEFHHQQIQWLYEQSYLTHEQIEELLALPRQSLIADLEKVLKDSIERYSYFEEAITSDKNGNFVMHSLLLFRELVAEDSLPVVLEVLSQSEEYLELFLGFILTEYLWEVLYVLGENRFEELLNFVKQPKIYTFAKTPATQAMAQFAVFNPDRRPEVVNGFKDVFDFYINAETDAGIDDAFIGSAICDVLDFCGVELENEIKTLFAKEYVDETICGDWDEISNELRYNTIFNHRNYHYTSLQEIYAIFQNNQADNEEDECDDGEDVGYVKPLSNVSNTPYIKPKVPGRNDPCFCGSGKKYKKCCL